MKKNSLRTATLFVIALFCAVTVMAQTQNTHPQNGKKIIVYDDGTWQYEIDYGTMKDGRDGQTYKTIKIGNHVWMAENLNYKINDSWCYDNNSSNCNRYGRLYNWNAANKACPSGWHLPSNNEWKTIELALGMSQSEVNDEGYSGTDEGEKMRSTSGWPDNRNGTNSSGFNALPGGYRDYSDGSFSGRYGGTWWLSSEHSGSQAWSRGLSNSGGELRTNRKGLGFSVRCLRN